MRFDWKRLLLQILASIAGGIGAVNLGRLTVPDVGAGPADLAGWVGVPALASIAGLIGQHFLRTPAAADKPGCAGHKEVCETLYRLAIDGQWKRATAVIEAWEKTIATAEAKP
jgi:hypothetical protein